MGLILAGGRGRRFGSDKVLEPVREGGPRMVEVAVSALQPYCERVVVLRAAPLPPELDTCMERWSDPGGGPLQALAFAMSREPAEAWLVSAADLPELRSGLFARLRRALADVDAVMVSGPIGPEPLVAAYAPSAAHGLIRAAQSEPDVSLRRLLTRLDTRVLVLSKEDERQLWNVNRREDLRQPPHRGPVMESSQ